MLYHNRPTNLISYILKDAGVDAIVCLWIDYASVRYIVVRRNIQHGRIKNILMIVGGLTGAFSIGLYASASSIGAVNIMLPSRYSLISVSCLLIAIAGGFSLWRMEKKSM